MLYMFHPWRLLAAALAPALAPESCVVVPRLGRPARWRRGPRVVVAGRPRHRGCPTPGVGGAPSLPGRVGLEAEGQLLAPQVRQARAICGRLPLQGWLLDDLPRHEHRGQPPCGFALCRARGHSPRGVRVPAGLGRRGGGHGRPTGQAQSPVALRGLPELAREAEAAEPRDQRDSGAIHPVRRLCSQGQRRAPAAAPAAAATPIAKPGRPGTIHGARGARRRHRGVALGGQGAHLRRWRLDLPAPCPAENPQGGACPRQPPARRRARGRDAEAGVQRPHPGELLGQDGPRAAEQARLLSLAGRALGHLRGADPDAGHPARDHRHRGQDPGCWHEQRGWLRRPLRCCAGARHPRGGALA
mmetsp:Transcript_56876/g.161422  ORF Transcript_56876/g.161422 Transcript_56876/m.161422 type:complete len:358 (+) Transcript_56876:190-1263(+)